MHSNGWLYSDPVQQRQQELLGEAERQRLVAYAETLAAQPGPASLLVAAFLTLALAPHASAAGTSPRAAWRTLAKDEAA